MRSLALVWCLGAAAACSRPPRPVEPVAATPRAVELADLVVPITVASSAEFVASARGDDRIVLLGEATHGSDEFYRARAAISLALVQDHGFAAITFEADWHAMERVDRYVRGEGEDRAAAEALEDFQRSARWMWRNEAFAAFVEDVRRHNLARSPRERVRLFGMDIYGSVHSADRVVAFLARHDAEAGRLAREGYRCLAYARGRAFAPGDDRCAHRVAAPLAAVERLADRDGAFSALQHARAARSAEVYYRLAQRPTSESWNHRERHMLGVLVAIDGELARERGEVRQLAWAHNSHMGDARATDFVRSQRLSLGQLARERWGDAVTIVGFTTFDGTVFAAPAQAHGGRIDDVRPARADSIEAHFHRVGLSAFALDLRTPEARALLPRLRQRAIGVIYLPDSELQSHSLHARITEQFDLVLHFDRTQAIVPLQ